MSVEKVLPKVTGLSPMTGPPGTKITIRGDNLGESSEDIIAITINGADCWPYLDWKSPKKVVTRCTRALGSGDVIITTKSGGVGTCEVQFNCYEDTVGPTEESAVWVNEINSTPEKEQLAISGTTEEFSVDITSYRFNPKLYLLHNYPSLELDEIEKLHQNLQEELSIKSNPEVVSSSSNRAALLKSNLSVIMECLQILESLSRSLTISKDPSMDNIVKSIKQTLAQTREVFGPLLAERDLVQSIESAMQIFRQNENLFNLPFAIDLSIKTKDYDQVVKEISGVLTRLETLAIDESLTKKIEHDVTSKITKLRDTIEAQLQENCNCNKPDRSIDEVKKLISHLNRLGEPVNYNIWTVMKQMRNSLLDTLSTNFSHFLTLSLEEAPGDCSYMAQCEKFLFSNPDMEAPFKVQFVQSAMKIFNDTYYDILALGQCYFDPKDEFFCDQSNEVKHANLIEFEDTMVTKPVAHLCHLLRQALVPESAKLEQTSMWPSNDQCDTYVCWLKHVLQSVLGCHMLLMKVNLPPTARSTLDDFKDLVYELRVSSMQILFTNAAKFNRQLHHHEDWQVEVDDLTGARTKLPTIFERNVVETLRFAQEIIFKTSLPEEKSILKQFDIQASMKELAQGLINSFIDSLDHALVDAREHAAEAQRCLVATMRDQVHRQPPKYLNRILITICNCDYTREQVFVRLQDEFEKLDGLKMERVFKVCSKKYGDYIGKISDKFCRIKCAELAKCAALSRTNKLQNNNNNNNNNNHAATSPNYGPEHLQMNLMIVNAQIYMVAPQLVNGLMTTIVNMMASERLAARSS